MPFWRYVHLPGEASTEQAIWTFPAGELEPGDLVLSPYDKRIVIEVIAYEGFSKDTHNRIIRYLSLNQQIERKDSYCFLWEHQVIRNGEIIYDANNPPPDHG